MTTESRLLDLFRSAKAWVVSHFKAFAGKRSELAPLTGAEQKAAIRTIFCMGGLLGLIAFVGGHVMMTGLGMAFAPVVMLELVRANSPHGETIGALIVKYRGPVLGYTTVFMIIMGLLGGSVTALATWIMLDMMKFVWVGYLTLLMRAGHTAA